MVALFQAPDAKWAEYRTIASELLEWMEMKIDILDDRFFPDNIPDMEVIIGLFITKFWHHVFYEDVVCVTCWGIGGQMCACVRACLCGWVCMDACLPSWMGR